jgi:hypothetical protein
LVSASRKPPPKPKANLSKRSDAAEFVALVEELRFFPLQPENHGKSAVAKEGMETDFALSDFF